MSKKKADIPTVQDKMETINETINMKLEDLEGIGAVRIKKLHDSGIFTIDDIVSRGEETIARMLDISYEDAKKLTLIASQHLNTDGIYSSMYVSGKDYYDYRKKQIKYMTTGLDELDEITGKYETGVITEYFGAFGSGKTQVMEVASIMAQLPAEACCLSCGKTEKPTGDKCECGGTWWNGGGLSEFGKPCRVIYIDTENSYRPERVYGMVCNRELVKTKPQTKTEEKQQLQKEPLDDEEHEKAMQFIYNVDVGRPRTSALQMLAIDNLSSAISGELCRICKKREIGVDGNPTHQNHPKAKDDMSLANHDFEPDKPAKLVIVDSITSKFRKEFEGRGTLSDRQMKLKSMVKVLESVVETKNVICLVTNQVSEKMDVMGGGDPLRPVGGNELGHTFTHRIYLKKPQSMTKNKIIAILVDSPNMAKNEITLELGGCGIQKPSE